MLEHNAIVAYAITLNNKNTLAVVLESSLASIDAI